MTADTLRAIDGIGIFPVISLLLFVVVFSVMLVRTALLNRDNLRRYARLPFDESHEAAAKRRPELRTANLELRTQESGEVRVFHVFPKTASKE